MSDNFNVGDLMAKTNAVPVPPFSIAPTGDNTNAINDWYDMDDLFQDDFFPKEVDFNDLFAFDEEQLNKHSSNMDTSFENDGMDVDEKDRTKVLMIPPVMPRSNVSALDEKDKTQKQKRMVKMVPVKRKLPPKASSGKSGGRARTSKSMIEMDYDDLDDGDLTEEQRIERRDRNREHAKQSRIRKRVLLDTLQDQLASLRALNVRLRRAVADRLSPDLAARVLVDCTTEESTLLQGDYDSTGPGAGSCSNSEDDAAAGATKATTAAGATGAVGGASVFRGVSVNVNGGAVATGSALTASIAADVIRFASDRAGSSSSSGAAQVAGGAAAGGAAGNTKILMEPDYRLIASLITSQQNFVLSDPSLPDNPIVYASDGFCRLTGYRRSDVLGRNCRFLQGPGTDQAAINVIRQGLADCRDISVCLLNYRADGSTFWNQFFLGALKDSQGMVVNYVGVQCEVNVLPIGEIKDRVKKLPLPDV